MPNDTARRNPGRAKARQRLKPNIQENVEEFHDRLVAHMPRLRSFAGSLTKDHAAADDLVQETILKALSNQEKFQPGTNLRAWLFTILKNTFLSDKRRSAREMEDVDGAYAAQLSSPASQEASVELNEVREALEEMPASQRQAVMLVGAFGFSYKAAAAACRCRTGTAKSRVNRARAQLARRAPRAGQDRLTRPARLARAGGGL